MFNFIPKLCQTGRVWGFEAMPWTLRTLARQTWPSSRDCKGAGTGIPIVWPQDDDRWYAAKEEIWSTGVGFYVPMFHITQLQRGDIISNKYGKVMWCSKPPTIGTSIPTPEQWLGWISTTNQEWIHRVPCGLEPNPAESRYTDCANILPS